MVNYNLTVVPGLKVKTVKKKLECFECMRVTLRDDRLIRQYQQVRDTYKSISNDSLLHGFRKRAGLPAPGESLGGWYGEDMFHTFGQYLSAYARMYRTTGDREVFDKANKLLDEWGKTIETDGFFFYSNKIPKAAHYTYDKIVGGLVDIYQYAGNNSAIEYLNRITDWAITNLDRSNPYAKNSFHSPTEWYTLSENLYRAYVFTGDEKYKKLGDEFLYEEFYSYFLKNDLKVLMQAGESSETRRYHAYSHVNSLCGAAMAYHITGEDRYLKTLENSYKMLKDTQLFVTGGYGPKETFMLPGQRAESLRSETFHFETPCGSWAAFKLSRYLIEFTGDARYGGWAEQLIYNCIGAALPIKSNGEVMYYSNYNIDGATKTTTSPWSCCTGTYPLDVTEYCNQIYYKNDDGIYINLYISSSVEWMKDDIAIKLEQTTRFPEEETSQFKLSLSKPQRFRVGFRIPEWCKEKFKIMIDGKDADAIIKDGWLIIEREWNDNDVVLVQLPMIFELYRVENDMDYPVALTLGPVVFVLVQKEKPVLTKSDILNFKTKLKRVDEKKLIFAGGLEDGTRVEFRPFYDLGEGETYFMYFDPTDNKISHEVIHYGPWESDWDINDFGHVSKGYIGFFKASFNGTGIRWVGHQMENGGKASVYLDGMLVDIVDQYGPFNGVPWIWEKNGLKYGKHEIYIKLENEKNVNLKWCNITKGCSINIMHLSVL